MKLYLTPGACSLACHIALQESGLPYTTAAVDLRSKTTAEGDFKNINPKGSVPTLRLDNGEVLTENAVILQYIADQKPEAKLIPAFGTWERYRCLEWLNFIATELHKGFSPLFRPNLSPELRAQTITTIAGKLAFVSEKLGGQPYLLGKSFSVADAYLFTMLTWANNLKVDMAPWPNLMSFYEQMRQRPAIATVLKEEGLV